MQTSFDRKLWREKRFRNAICQDCKSKVYLDRSRCLKHLLRNAKCTKNWRDKRRLLLKEEND